MVPRNSVVVYIVVPNNSPTTVKQIFSLVLILTPATRGVQQVRSVQTFGPRSATPTGWHDTYIHLHPTTSNLSSFCINIPVHQPSTTSIL